MQNQLDHRKIILVELDQLKSLKPIPTPISRPKGENRFENKVENPSNDIWRCYPEKNDDNLNRNT